MIARRSRAAFLSSIAFLCVSVLLSACLLVMSDYRRAIFIGETFATELFHRSSLGDAE
jgi:hypothetical protein